MFNSSFISLIFDADGKHESWEADQNAPKEIILTSASLKDKGDAVEDYDESQNPTSFSCPVAEGPRRMLGPIEKLKDKFNKWFKKDKTKYNSKLDSSEYLKSIF